MGLLLGTDNKNLSNTFVRPIMDGTKSIHDTSRI